MIEQIEVDGYRLLDGFKADLRPLNVIIGANASGKSSLLDFLMLVQLCCRWSLHDACKTPFGPSDPLTFSGEAGELRWKLSFRKPAAEHWQQIALDEKELLTYEVALQPDQQGRIQSRYEVLQTSKPRPGHKDPFKYLESTTNRRQIFDRKQGKLVPFDEMRDPHVQTANENRLSMVREPDSRTVDASIQEHALLLSQIRFPNEYPIPSAARWVLSHMVCYPGFDVTKLSALRTKAAEIEPDTCIAHDGRNLGSVLHEILTRYAYKDSAEDLRDFLRAAFPQVEDISCETTYGKPPQIMVRLREKGASRGTEIWEISDGMLRFLCLATALLDPVPSPVVAIDEPELGLHPGLLPVVADMIKLAKERRQVLVTTHSPELLDHFDVDDIAVMARCEDEMKSSWHRPANRKSLVRMLQKVTGESLGSLHRSGELEASIS